MMHHSMDPIADAAPRRLARTAGALYLVNIVAGAFAIGVVPALLAVPGDAAATAYNVQAHELLYRLGLVAHIVVGLTNVPLAVIFYDLFRVVSGRLALLVVFFTLVGTAVETAGILNQLAPLFLLGGGSYASALPPAQLQALAYLPGDLAGPGYSISSVFFAFYALCLAYLVLWSRFLPRAIGVPWIQLPVLPGEGSLCLWLLMAGVDVERWRARAIAAFRTWPVPAESLA